ncbi:MAG: HIRAN domain-containing protein [Deltaproteobacteria bacterium]|jgi:hypothetical protein|nr:HIRAN domain-containing protein [Deltaproteobacteria bacterium]
MYERSRNLFDCHIAGFTYYDGLDVIKKLKLGTPVRLKAEPDNPHDPDAVSIYYKKYKLGYIPRAKNSLVSQMLNFGYTEIFEANIFSRNRKANMENMFRIVIKLKDNRKKNSG